MFYSGIKRDKSIKWYVISEVKTHDVVLVYIYYYSKLNRTTKRLFNFGNIDNFDRKCKVIKPTDLSTVNALLGFD